MALKRELIPVLIYQLRPSKTAAFVEIVDIVVDSGDSHVRPAVVFVWE